MARYFLIPYLLLLGIASVLLADRAWKSVTAYQSDYAVEAELSAGEPLTERLFFILLDGVRLDAVDHMPALREFAGAAARGTAAVCSPSLSNPARATISTGAWPEIHGVTNNGVYSSPPIDSLFSLARAADVSVAVYGSDFWRKAFGDYLGPNTLEFEKELHVVDEAAPLIEWQDEVCGKMVPFFEQQATGLLVAGVTATDSAGHDFGGESEEYVEVLGAADRCVARLIEATNDDRTSYVITSDHGHIHRRNQGGHGGNEPEVMHVPIILGGNTIRASADWKADQTDIAPTIAALLGLPLPANNQGRILFEALRLTPAQRSALEARETAQQGLLAERLPDRSAVLEEERASRGLVSVAALAAFALLAAGMLYFAAEDRRKMLIATGVFGALYAFCFYAFGLGYSLSIIVREEYLNGFFLRDMTAAAIAFGFASVVLQRRILPLAALIAALFGLRVAWVHWEHGLLMQRTMPDLGQAFMAYMDLLAIFAVVITALIMAGFWAFLRNLKNVGPEPN